MGAASLAESRKAAKYSSLSGSVIFYASGLETLGAIGPSPLRLLYDIVSRVTTLNGEFCARSRLCRRIAATIQIGNVACITDAHSLEDFIAEIIRGLSIFQPTSRYFHILSVKMVITANLYIEFLTQ